MFSLVSLFWRYPLRLPYLPRGVYYLYLYLNLYLSISISISLYLYLYLSISLYLYLYLASSLVVTLTYAEISMEKSRFLRAHGHGHGHGHGRAAEGKGATGRDEAERKDRARAENAQTASNDGNDGAVAFRALKTKNGAAIAVRDGGHDIGRADPTSWASARASTASGSHRRRVWTFDSSVVTPAAIERAPQPSG